MPDISYYFPNINDWNEVKKYEIFPWKFIAIYNGKKKKYSIRELEKSDRQN